MNTPEISTIVDELYVPFFEVVLNTPEISTIVDVPADVLPEKS